MAETLELTDIAHRIAAIALNGLAFTRDPYDVERYGELRRIAAEMIAARIDADVLKVEKALRKEDGYATPKLDVRGAAFLDGKLLMVRERSDNGWTLPGGWADVGQTPSEAVVKEIKEEAGFDTRVVKLIALYDRRRHGHTPSVWHMYKIFFLCEIVGGAPMTSIETSDVAFFGEDDLPERLSVGRVTSAQLGRCFEHYRNPSLSAEFD